MTNIFITLLAWIRALPFSRSRVCTYLLHLPQNQTENLWPPTYASNLFPSWFRY